MKIKTINGEEILKENARKIKRDDGSFGYYKIGNVGAKDSGDCYQINNIFYTIEKGRIVWDYALKQYVLRTSTIEGVIDNYFTIGNFNASTEPVFLFVNELKRLVCVNREIPIALGYIEGVRGNFYNPQHFTYRQIFPRQRVDSGYKNSLLYNFKDYLTSCKRNYDNNFKVITDQAVEGIYQMAPHLFDKYSFGIELETTQGMIPEEVYKNLGVMPVRDGSISGLEYVTIPLQGKKGVYAFKEILDALIKYTDSNYTCSMHVHVGGIPRTMEFIVAMFKFGFYFQDSLYPMFPGYKRINDGIKRQCYTGPLDNLLATELNFKSNERTKVAEDYNKIVYALSGKNENFRSFVDLNDIQGHPSDPHENSKWHMKERYKWINLIPLIFTNKQTVEYRIFTVPDTIDKGFGFLLLSLMLTDVVVKNTSTILSKPGFSKGIDTYNLVDYTKVNSVLKYVFEERLMRANHQTNNKGAFFEESALVLNQHIYRKPIVAKKKVEKKIDHFFDEESALWPSLRDVNAAAIHSVPQELQLRGNPFLTVGGSDNTDRLSNDGNPRSAQEIIRQAQDRSRRNG